MDVAVNNALGEVLRLRETSMYKIDKEVDFIHACQKPLKDDTIPLMSAKAAIFKTGTPGNGTRDIERVYGTKVSQRGPLKRNACKNR
jgi:hypothetical protein